jgi:arylsulfatase A-like enzyme
MKHAPLGPGSLAIKDLSIARRDFIKVCVAGTGSAAFTNSLARGTLPLGDRATPSRPNILYIHSHDTGRYIQSYGYNVPTPNLHRIAEEGVLFREAFCAAPTCSPSRAALLTGMCPHSAGMLGLAHRGFALNDYHQHLLHTLRSAGYSSTLVGVQHVAPHTAMIGYDQVREFPGNFVEQVTPATVDFLKSSPKQAFFLDVGFHETHRTFRTPGPQENPVFQLPPAPIADAPETRQDVAAFKASARILDWGIGEILRALDASGLAKNTLVISTTDHGIAFPEMKCNLYDGGVGVRLAMRGPGGFEGGALCDAMISQIDIFPTLCDLLQIEPPQWLQGKSFLPVLRKQVAETNEEIFAEVNYHAAYEPLRGVRTKRWKYIRRFGSHVHPVLCNCDDGPTKSLWVKNGWGDQILPREELFDLLFDPNEGRNLVDGPAFQPALRDMRGRLDRWMRATNDPLLAGPVIAPQGASVTDADCVSIREGSYIVP